MMKAKKKEAEVKKKIILSIAPRGKKKAVTVVQGRACECVAFLEAELFSHQVLFVPYSLTLSHYHVP